MSLWLNTQSTVNVTLTIWVADELSTRAVWFLRHLSVNKVSVVQVFVVRFAPCQRARRDATLINISPQTVCLISLGIFRTNIIRNYFRKLPILLLKNSLSSFAEMRARRNVKQRWINTEFTWPKLAEFFFPSFFYVIIKYLFFFFFFLIKVNFVQNHVLILCLF